MNISGSSITAYYAGNAALGVDSQAARQQRDKSTTTHALKEVKPAKPREPILEGELVKERLKNKPLDDSMGAEEFFAQHQFVQGAVTDRHASQAIAEYKDTARMDGFGDAKPLLQLDLYV